MSDSPIKDLFEPSYIGDHFTLGHRGQDAERQGKRSFEITRSHFQKKTFSAASNPHEECLLGRGWGKKKKGIRHPRVGDFPIELPSEDLKNVQFFKARLR